MAVSARPCVCGICVSVCVRETYESTCDCLCVYVHVFVSACECVCLCVCVLTSLLTIRQCFLLCGLSETPDEMKY